MVGLINGTCYTTAIFLILMPMRCIYVRKLHVSCLEMGEKTTEKQSFQTSTLEPLCSILFHLEYIKPSNH